MRTSEIAARLRHSSPAVTRAWIRRTNLEAKGRDLETGEKTYSRAEIEQAIAAMPRGGYNTARPSAEGQHDGDDPGPTG